MNPFPYTIHLNPNDALYWHLRHLYLQYLPFVSHGHTVRVVSWQPDNGGGQYDTGPASITIDIRADTDEEPIPDPPPIPTSITLTVYHPEADPPGDEHKRVITMRRWAKEAEVIDPSFIRSTPRNYRWWTPMPANPHVEEDPSARSSRAKARRGIR